MALYRYSQFLASSTSDEFNKLFNPGTRCSWSGIYRCEGCGHEIVHTHEKPLPPQNSHTHTNPYVAIQWRLVATDYTPSA